MEERYYDRGRRSATQPGSPDAVPTARKLANSPTSRSIVLESRLCVMTVKYA